MSCHDVAPPIKGRLCGRKMSRIELGVEFQNFVGKPEDTVYDLTILYMSDVTNWCEYLFDIFNPFEVYQQSEEITDFPTHESTIHHIKSSRVQVLIISPKFIETATTQIREITGKNSVVGLLCGVEKEELSKLQDRIPDYVNWHLVDAKDGPRCITSTTLDIVDEMIKLADQQVPPEVAGGDSDLYLPMTGKPLGGGSGGPENNYVSMGGKGVGSASQRGPQEDSPYQDMGVKKVLPDEELYLEMDEQRIQDDDIYLDMNVPGEDLYLSVDSAPAPPAEELYLEMDIVPAPPAEELYLEMDLVPAPKEKDEDVYSKMEGDEMCNDDTYDMGGTLPTRGAQCRPIVVPDKVRAGVAEKVVLIFTQSNMVQNFDGSYKIHIAFEKKSADVVARVLNPHTLRFESPPDLPGGGYKCTLTHNGMRKATFRLSIQSPTAILSDILSKTVSPLHYLCDVLGISPADSNQLDNELHEQCKKYMPQEGFKDLLPVKQPSSGKQSTVFPTALHFAAKFGLPCVCAMLCQWPGADQALRIKNIEGKTPDQMTTDEQVRSYLLGNKERSAAQQQERSDMGYVKMIKDQQKNRAKGNQSEADGVQSSYDIPFLVPIPVNPVSKDADIHRLISGDPDDIYNYYDSWEKTDLGSAMVRDGDDDDDDDDTQDLPPPPPVPRVAHSRPPSDYETLDSEAPSKVHHDTAPAVSSSDDRPEPPAASSKPVQSQSDNKTARDPDTKLQSLIDIQNRVKDHEISMDEAVVLFKEWEQNHNQSQSMGGRKSAEDRHSSMIQKFKRKLERPPRGIPTHAAGGRAADISEKPERSPTSPVPSRLQAINGNSENTNGPASDPNRSENGSESSPMEPPPPRSPRPTGARDPSRRMSWRNRNQPDFSPEYMDRPIPPIPPRITSAAPSSNYSRLPAGARPVMMFPPEQRGAGRTPLPGMTSPPGAGAGRGEGGMESDAIPEHSEHTVTPSPEGIPERMAPLPPRRSSNDSTRNTLGETARRQSDPSVPSKDGGEPTTPPGDRDASGRPRRPIPRPRAPRPRP